MNTERVAGWIWLALLGSVVLYVVVAYVVPVGPTVLPVGVLTKALYVVAAILLVSAVLIHRRLLSPELVRKYAIDPLVRGGSSPESEEGRERARYHAGAWVLRVNIISWAVAESISVLGLVAALITARPPTILPFAVITLLLLLRLRPDFSVLDSISPRHDPRA